MAATALVLCETERNRGGNALKASRMQSKSRLKDEAFGFEARPPRNQRVIPRCERQTIPRECKLPQQDLTATRKIHTGDWDQAVAVTDVVRVLGQYGLSC
jgi:hypothetical protein